MLAIKNISFTLEGRKLIDSSTVTIPSGHKVGIVGRNGAGKTTLFKLIRGEWVLDEGEIEIPRGARIGGIAQEVPSGPESLISVVLAADVERTDLLAEAETATDPTRISDIYMRLADIEAHSAEARAASILHGLGFDNDAQQQPCSDFSGGWRMRVALAAVLFSQPDFLLLDEPTNYLDLEGSIWLEQYLTRYPHTVLIISHDKALLNRSVTQILHLDQQKLTLYTGNYDTFENTRRAKLEQLVAQKKKQDAQREHMESYINRFRAQASKAKQAQSRIKALARMGTLAPIVGDHVTPFNFPEPEELSPPIIRLENASVGYDDKVILRNLDLRIDQDDRIALLGANGQGKSTFAKLLADRLTVMSGSKYASSKLRVGFFAQHQVDELDLDETPIQHIHRLRPKELAGRIRSRLAAGGMSADIVDTKVGNLSGGQKARLSLLIATIDAPHMIILDEPTNHLDIQSREALVAALTEYTGAVILVSHDQSLVELVADRLWLVKGGNVTPYTEDMGAYRKMLLSERGGLPKSEKKKQKGKKPKKVSKEKLREEVASCEERVTTLQGMRDKLDLKMAEPGFYDGEAAAISMWQKKHVEVTDGLERAETLWMDALEKLEARG
ncbi:MAG: ABC-F family ATP-binding cassette domain-containing protein [Rhodobacteraceae bacterium]|nr:ABC-F family ATP-binding cassette domain-containing protein [Paracoccaceae bacterium]